MGKFKLDDYETVESRLKTFHENYKDCKVVTFLESPREKLDSFACFQAAIIQDGSVVATGWAYEGRDYDMKTSNSGSEYAAVNYTSWVENAETSAIGRALANFGLSGNKRASREEMQKVERMTNFDANICPRGNFKGKRWTELPEENLMSALNWFNAGEGSKIHNSKEIVIKIQEEINRRSSEYPESLQ